MKTWYCVTTSFDDRGRVTAGLTVQKRSEKKPADTSTSTKRKDIYNTWFDNLVDANIYIEETLKC